MNRYERRAIEKKTGKGSTKDLSEKICQFNKLPDGCSACQKSFDKKDKEMAESWNVVVKQEVVRLFCPECIHKTREVLRERK